MCVTGTGLAPGQSVTLEESSCRDASSPLPPHLILANLACFLDPLSKLTHTEVPGRDCDILPKGTYNLNENWREDVADDGGRRAACFFQAQPCFTFTSSTQHSSGTQKVLNMCESNDHLA